MTIMAEAKNALKNGTSSVLSAVQHRSKSAGRFPPVDAQKLMKQMTGRFKRPQARRLPIVPIAIVVGGMVVGTTAALLVRRFLAARSASAEEEEFTEQEAALDGHPEEELVTSR